MRIGRGIALLLFLLAIVPGVVLAQQSKDSTRVDSTLKTGRYGGYATWEDYLHHQDSVPFVYKEPPVNLGWVSWGIGGSNALTYGIDFVIEGLLTYQRDNLVYSLRYFDQHDYNGGGAGNPERVYEYDALVGLGAYSPYVLVNGLIGIGFRHEFHYLSDPYEAEQNGAPPPTSETLNSLAVPVQFNLMVPVYHGVMGVGISAYATYTSQGFDSGFALMFYIGRLTEDANLGHHFPP